MVRPSRGEASPGMWRREAGTVVRRAVAVPEQAAAPFAISAGLRVPRVPTEWAPHSHPLHELVWVRGGTLTSRVEDRVFTVFEGHGLWAPAGVVHGGRATAGAQFHNAFFAPDRTPFAFGEPEAIAMTPLLESLLTHLFRTDLDAPARAWAESVVFDVIQPSGHRFALQLPGDPRIDAIAEALLDDPADSASLEEWARRLGISDRTITRAFRQATGLSFADQFPRMRARRTGCCPAPRLAFVPCRGSPRHGPARPPRPLPGEGTGVACPVPARLTYGRRTGRCPHRPGPPRHDRDRGRHRPTGACAAPALARRDAGVRRAALGALPRRGTRCCRDRGPLGQRNATRPPTESIWCRRAGGCRVRLVRWLCCGRSTRSDPRPLAHRIWLHLNHQPIRC